MATSLLESEADIVIIINYDIKYRMGRDTGEKGGCNSAEGASDQNDDTVVKGRSVMEILNSSPERRRFQADEEVKAYLAKEKASWNP